MKKKKATFYTVVGTVELDISKKTLYFYGFYHGDTILNPRGEEATVIGVYKGDLYYQKKDGDITRWSADNLKKEELMRAGFKLVRKAKE